MAFQYYFSLVNAAGLEHGFGQAAGGRKGSGLRAEMVALRPIAAGEELLQSYVDEGLPFQERQLALQEYGFTCQCPRCLQQL
jgi:hypothetical protein